MPSRLRRAVTGAAVLVALQGALVGLYLSVEAHRRGRDEPFPVERVTPRAAPEAEVAGADGSTRRLSDRRGRAVLLHFWAPWCVPCRDEMPDLLALGRELARASGPELVAVATDTDWPAVREFFAGEVPPEVLLDETGAAARAWDVSTLPDSFLVGADGSLRYRLAGARSWRGPAAREFLRSAAAGAN